MNNKKVKILEAFYDTKRNLVKIKIQDIIDHNIILSLVFPCSDFGQFIGQLTGIYRDIPSESIPNICKNLIGIEFTHIAEVDIKNNDKQEISKIDEKEINKYHNILDKYPYYEVLESIREEENIDGDKI